MGRWTVVSASDHEQNWPTKRAIPLHPNLQVLYTIPGMETSNDELRLGKAFHRQN